MKRLLSIALIACLFLPVLGMFGWLHYQKRMVRKEIKHRMMEGMNQDQLVLLSFTAEEAAQLRWEHSREFEYRGEMYDVVETIIEGDTTHYWCWPDKVESELNKQLAALTEQAMNQHPQRQDQQTQVLSFFKTLYFTSGEVIVPTSYLPLTPKGTFYFLAYKEPDLGAACPPPRLG